MSAMARPTPRPKLPQRKPARADDGQVAFRRIATLAMLALALSLLAGAFAGIVLFVAGLATFAAYAASHPHHT